MCVLPCCRTGAMPEQREVSPLPQAPRCHIPVPSAHLEAEEGNSHFSNRGFLCSLAPGWQDLEQFPKGAGGCERTKRGCEKFLLCLIYTGSKLFAPSNKCSYSFSWPSEEEVNIFGATPHHQRKRQPMNMVPLLSTETETTAAGHCPGGKRLKRTNITACAMRDAPLAHR